MTGLSATTHSWLARAGQDLRESQAAKTSAVRYQRAYTAALKAAAAFTVGKTPARTPGMSQWVYLAEVAPEYGEWARHFADMATTKADDQISERAADAALRETDRFMAIIERRLGLAPHLPVHPENDQQPIR